jgi:hypothetical protein
MRADKLEDRDGHWGQVSLGKGLGKVEAVQPRTRLAAALPLTLLGDPGDLGLGLGSLGDLLGESLNHPNGHGRQGLLRILGKVARHQLLGVQVVVLGQLTQEIPGVPLKLVTDTQEEMGKAGEAGHGAGCDPQLSHTQEQYTHILGKHHILKTPHRLKGGATHGTRRLPIMHSSPINKTPVMKYMPTFCLHNILLCNRVITNGTVTTLCVVLTTDQDRTAINSRLHGTLAKTVRLTVLTNTSPQNTISDITIGTDFIIKHLFGR